MWLDRFSGNNPSSASPPQPSIRSYSPGPRRPSLLRPGTAARPSFSQRSSSLYLGSKSNLSTASINSARVPNGSTLKNEIVPPGEFPDPLTILAEVVGQPLLDQTSETIKDGEEEADRPSILTENVDFEGMSLHEFVQLDLSDKGDEQQGLGFSPQTVEECEYVCPCATKSVSGLTQPADEREKDKLEDLHLSILVNDYI
jgi:vacuolar protein sorting-associated protein 52